jgi:hypothetical protein
VKKGERGIRILAPIVGVRRKREEEAEKDITQQNRPVLGRLPQGVRFRLDRRERISAGLVSLPPNAAPKDLLLDINLKFIGKL